MSFLYDWYDTKKRYPKEQALPILNLDVNYHHNEDNDADILTISKGKEISLKNASSGLQSVIPLAMLIDYLTGEFFENPSPMSINESKELESTIEREIKQFRDKNPEVQEDKVEKDFVNFLMDIRDLRSNYIYSQFIIEEPEQNLFPATQRDLVYYILEKINNKEREHRLILTTHSPYILYALNNCMMGYNIQEKMPADIKSELPSSQSWINPKQVSVWEIVKNEGTVRSIQNGETGTVSEHYFNRVMNEVMDEYYEMLNFFDV